MTEQFIITKHPSVTATQIGGFLRFTILALFRSRREKGKKGEELPGKSAPFQSRKIGGTKMK
jgi:hypothetical protein